MSTVQAAKAISYATLILADESLEINKDRLSALLTAAKVQVEPIWLDIYADAFKGKDLKELITNFSAGSGAAAGGPAAAAPAGGAAAGGAAEEAKETKTEEAEESDDDMGFGLFD